MTAGRPWKFKTVEDLQQLIDAYFLRCKTENEPLTITGLAIALDTDRSTLIEYAENRGEEFSYTIRRAKTLVEQDYEKRLISRGNSGDIFGLKNFGWTDQQNIGLGNFGGGPIQLHTAMEILGEVVQNEDQPETE